MAQSTEPIWKKVMAEQVVVDERIKKQTKPGRTASAYAYQNGAWASTYHPSLVTASRKKASTSITVKGLKKEHGIAKKRKAEVDLAEEEAEDGQAATVGTTPVSKPKAKRVKTESDEGQDQESSTTPTIKQEPSEKDDGSNSADDMSKAVEFVQPPMSTTTAEKSSQTSNAHKDMSSPEAVEEAEMSNSEAVTKAGMSNSEAS